MKYWRTFLLAIQREFNTRINLIGWFLVGTIPTIVLVLVWFSILGAQESLNGFTRGDFIVYYLAMTVSWYIVGGTFGRTVGYQIKDGAANTTLLKPYNIVLGTGIKEQAWKVLSFLISIPVTLTVIFLFRDIIHVNFSFYQTVLLVISLILGGLNFAFIEALIGISAFWVTEIWPVVQVNDIFQSLFGGRYIPLALMPPSVLWLTNILPFKYLFYVPVSILLSKNNHPLTDISIQLVYLILLFLLYKLVWNLGIKKYEAVGI